MSWRSEDEKKLLTAFLLWRAAQPEMTDDEAVEVFVKEREMILPN